MNTFKKGFTLIELLVVIAILAVLATVIVVIINPAQLLRQARDTTRISDLAALNSAIALYLSDVAAPSLGTTTNANCTVGTTSPFTITPCVTNATTSVNGTGWIPVDFTGISSGSPLSRLPLDPTQVAPFFYAFAWDTPNLRYEIDAKMESDKYATTTATSVMKNSYDGGNNANYYEVGNYLTL